MVAAERGNLVEDFADAGDMRPTSSREASVDDSERVEVHTGPFKGFKGVIVARNDDGSVEATLAIFGRDTNVSSVVPKHEVRQPILSSSGSILIEGQPTSFSRLLTNRPGVVVANTAICTQHCNVSFTKVSSPTAQLEEVPSEKAVTVPCAPMQAILDTVGIKHIDFFSLDVEGAELNVLHSIDWRRLRCLRVQLPTRH